MTDCSILHVCFEARVTVQLASLSPTVMCIGVSKNHRPFFLQLPLFFVSPFISTSWALLHKVGKLRDRSLSACLVNNWKVCLSICFFMFLDKDSSSWNILQSTAAQQKIVWDLFSALVKVYFVSFISRSFILLIKLLRSNVDLSRWQRNGVRSNSSSITRRYPNPILLDKRIILGKSK